MHTSYFCSKAGSCSDTAWLRNVSSTAAASDDDGFDDDDAADDDDGFVFAFFLLRLLSTTDSFCCNGRSSANLHFVMFTTADLAAFRSGRPLRFSSKGFVSDWVADSGCEEEDDDDDVDDVDDDGSMILVSSCTSLSSSKPSFSDGCCLTSDECCSMIVVMSDNICASTRFFQSSPYRLHASATNWGCVFR